MHMTEQLPDIRLVSTLEAEKRIVAELDFLFPYLYPHLHGDMLKASDKSLTYILQVVIAENKIYPAIESVENLGPFRCTAETEVAEMKHYIIRCDCIVPVRYDCLVHFVNVTKRTLAVADYIHMVEMGI